MTKGSSTQPSDSRILTINGGSSSIKFALYQIRQPLKRGLYGKIDRIGLGGTNLEFHDPATNQQDTHSLAATDHKTAANALIEWLQKQNGFEAVRAVGHRVVHGMQHTAPELITQELLDELHSISPYDPDHLPREIELIEAFRLRHPKLPQVACFDTAFHRLALLRDLFHWQRLGLATFGPYQGIEFGGVDDKEASLFPVAIPNPSGHPEPAMLYRPLFPGTRPEGTACDPASRKLDHGRESTWISYSPMALKGREPYRLDEFTYHHRLATPASPWERLKIGGGTPPILTRHGWLIVYHGVSEMVEPGKAGHQLCYSAGVMVLPKEHPRVIRYRCSEPVLTPVLPQERRETAANAVSPTGIDRRDDLGSPDRFDVYYGMADKRIGMARLDVPDFVPTGGVADPPDGKV